LIYVNGDSWSFRHTEYKFNIWPEIIATERNEVLINDAVGCGSNSRIASNLLDRQINEFSPDLILIGLTGHHRFHIPSVDFGSWSISPGFARNDRTGQTNESMVKVFYSNCFDEIGGVYRYYRDIWQITKIARESNSRCLLFQMWDTSLNDYNLLSSDDNIYNFVGKFYNIDSYYYDEFVTAFKNLKAKSKDWEYWEEPIKLLQSEIDKTGHPNELGHKKIASFVSSKI
jgi:hypothetical protein